MRPSTHTSEPAPQQETAGTAPTLLRSDAGKGSAYQNRVHASAGTHPALRATPCRERRSWQRLTNRWREPRPRLTRLTAPNSKIRLRGFSILRALKPPSHCHVLQGHLFAISRCGGLHRPSLVPALPRKLAVTTHSEPCFVDKVMYAACALLCALHKAV